MMTTDNSYHIPVLLRESIEGLNIRSDGVYVDLTYGGGGHSNAILNKLTTGKLIAFDKDDDSPGNSFIDPRFIFVNHDFIYLKRFLKYYGYTQVNGILADLGVSSHQFDVPERGFTHRFDERLDMRMDKNQELSAFDIINNYPEKEIASIIYQYGELKESRMLARSICNSRLQTKIETSAQLTEIIRKVSHPKYESRNIQLVFQALRIAVNNEIEALKEFLSQSVELTASGGRIAIISYHSLEDRLVKNYFNSGNFEGKVEKDMYGNALSQLKLISKKAITATEKEITENPRSRSARLRIAEKQ